MQKWIGSASIEEDIHAAPVAVRPHTGLPVLPALSEGVDVRRLRGVDPGPADLRGEQAAGAESGVAYNLGIEPDPVLAGQKIVARVDFPEVGPGMR